MIQQHIQHIQENISDRMKDRSVISVNGLVDEIRKIDGKEYNLVRVVITKLKKQNLLQNIRACATLRLSHTPSDSL